MRNISFIKIITFMLCILSKCMFCGDSNNIFYLPFPQSHTDNYYIESERYPNNFKNKTEKLQFIERANTQLKNQNDLVKEENNQLKDKLKQANIATHNILKENISIINSTEAEQLELEEKLKTLETKHNEFFSLVNEEIQYLSEKIENLIVENNQLRNQYDNKEKQYPLSQELKLEELEELKANIKIEKEKEEEYKKNVNNFFFLFTMSPVFRVFLFGAGSIIVALIIILLKNKNVANS